MMKITGARWNNDRQYYCVDYDDGITLFVNEQYESDGLISTGPSSYFLTKGKWPASSNIKSRLKLAAKWIDKNKNRYKPKK